MAVEQNIVDGHVVIFQTDHPVFLTNQLVNTENIHINSSLYSEDRINTESKN